jgi:ABC-2 type transport system ATP-binding protein
VNSIEVSGLTKRYGRVEALEGADLSVGRGEIFGLVGPNGAGKTTLIKGLVGALRPSGGTARVMGLNPLRDRAVLRQRIGYMPQSAALYEDLSARDNVRFFGAAHRTPDLKKKVDEIMHFSDLSGRADDPVHTFSGGMKRRVSLACALVHRPTAEEPVLEDFQGTSRRRRDPVYQHAPDGRGDALRPHRDTPQGQDHRY